MNISLTPRLEKFVNDRVKSGQYASASEVVRDALRLLEDEQKLRDWKLEELRKEVQKGLEDYKNGRFKTFETGQQVADYIKKKAREKLSKNN